MTSCSMTSSQEAAQWPEGIISAKITMNPYLFAYAEDQSYRLGMKPWEFVNVALWEKLGKPDSRTLTEFAANLELDEEDPKWKKRLKITARHELAIDAAKKERLGASPPADGDGT